MELTRHRHGDVLIVIIGIKLRKLRAAIRTIEVTGPLEDQQNQTDRGPLLLTS
jgi:hypothetical protein